FSLATPPPALHTLSLHDALPIYLVIAAATLVGVGMNFAHIDPIRALFVTAVINGLVAPPLLVLIVLLGSDRRVMGDRASGRLSQDRKSTRLNSSHVKISYAVFCL